MADFPYIQIWVADFVGDTQHLDCRETGAYLLLIFAAWRSNECALPDDDKKLARMARCSLKVWLTMKPTIMAFWTLGADGLWHQKKLDEVRRQANIKSIKATQSAQAKWLKERERQAALAEPTHSVRNANHNHNQNISLTSNHTDPARAASLSPTGFAAHAKPPSMNQRMAAIAAKSRKAFVGNA